ncbi:839_t:CDS:2 [Funneliformis mosseae]|uniref:839_t:CDS:1 n=1 Tax=Funneliformis mosseae TaxID=27381 RepID=A0A9N9E637_FUNMO|nr:839_t:CDS:2 [Funneliformis mosseae]
MKVFMSEPIYIKITSTLDIVALSSIFCAITSLLRALRIYTLSCFDDLDTNDEKCTYLRSLILTFSVLPTSYYQTSPQVIVENLVAVDENAKVVVNPSFANEPSISTSRSIPKDIHLPENASQLLRYYEIETLIGLFSKDHPAQLRLVQLENQLKASCMLSYWVDPHLYTSSYFVNPREIFVSD